MVPLKADSIPVEPSVRTCPGKFNAPAKIPAGIGTVVSAPASNLFLGIFMRLNIPIYIIIRDKEKKYKLVLSFPRISS
jgi:hypothetical protein